MNATVSFLKFEWRRTRASFAVACGILILLTTAAYLLPGRIEGRGLTLQAVAVPALLIPALFSSLASDTEQWPFLFGLPYSGAKLFWLRLLFRLPLLLLPVSFIATLALVMTYASSGVPMSGTLFWMLIGLSLLLYGFGNLAFASIYVFLAPLTRGISLLMAAILGWLVFIPAQFPAAVVCTWLTESEFLSLILPAIQLTLLATLGGFFLWRCRLVNRSPYRTLALWGGLILLLPILEWGGACLISMPLLAAAKQQAQESGIILIEPDSTPGQTSRADIKAYLAGFGYAPDQEPFYCSAMIFTSPHRENIRTFVQESVAPHLYKDFKAGNAKNMQEDVNIEFFCNFVALGNILYHTDITNPAEGEALQTLITQLETARKYNFSRRYALDLERAAEAERRPSIWKPLRFLEFPLRNDLKTKILRRETESFRAVTRIEAMPTDQLERYSNDRILYRLVLTKKQCDIQFDLFTQALKLKLELHRSGKLPETLDTELPYRYERTENGFRFLDRKGNTVLNYQLPKRNEAEKGE